MSLADLIIEHGPYESYAVVPNEVMRFIESDQLNTLRAELIAGRLAIGQIRADGTWRERIFKLLGEDT